MVASRMSQTIPPIKGVAAYLTALNSATEFADGYAPAVKSLWHPLLCP